MRPWKRPKLKNLWFKLMDDTLQIILQDSYSLSSVKHHLRVLKAQLSRGFFGAEAIKDLSDADLIWISSLPKDFLTRFNKDNLSQIFSELEAKINQIQTLIIYIPFESNDEIAKAISTKIKETFQKQILLDIKLDPGLIGGCALSFKGIYKDFSIRARIEEKKSELSKNFKQFLK